MNFPLLDLAAFQRMRLTARQEHDQSQWQLPDF